MNKITGYRQSAGSFNNEKGEKVNYDNTLFNVITDENPDYKGLAPGGEFKVKTSEILELTGGLTADKLIDKEVSFDVFMLSGEPKVHKIHVLTPKANPTVTR